MDLKAQGTYLQFTDGNLGTNLSSWRFSGNDEQKWEFATAGQSSAYTILNAKYQNYAAWAGNLESGEPYVFAGQAPYSWFVEQTNGSYTISPTPDFKDTWNVEDGYNGNDINIIIYHGITLFNINSTHLDSTTNSTFTNGTSSKSDGGGLSEGDKLNAGIAVASLFVGILGIWIAYLGIKGEGPFAFLNTCCRREAKNKYKELQEGDPDNKRRALTKSDRTDTVSMDEI
ncbi:hypothetical protein M422DRAFT_47418 [Sphaerobolus stellatus SS14]|uniref:Ricin B lectin domain-containing protein n=1 Tax=Sphaerobolus stellatus (strain SS14) TaxID=990650 RepID=A0A0C9VQ06_SPHS4|nr:hypothetical protein M422DRAFT_47418 [Sphaerobolus stellatus SS14]